MQPLLYLVLLTAGLRAALACVFAYNLCRTIYGPAQTWLEDKTVGWIAVLVPWVTCWIVCRVLCRIPLP